jgi:hypothetical protein
MTLILFTCAFSEVAAAQSLLYANPTSVSFGSVAVGQTAQSTVEVGPIEGMTITIQSATVTGGGFALAAGTTFPFTLNIGAWQGLNVTFAPTAAGAATGSLTITSNASSNPTLVVPLTGTGTGGSSGGSSAPVPKALTCLNATMSAAGTDSCTVTISAAAPAGGASIKLASNDKTVTVPSSVTVSAGATTATFNATVAAFTTAQTANLTANSGSTTITYALQLQPGSGPVLSANATTISFGNVVLNSTATQPLMLYSTGSAALVINSASVTGTGFSSSGLTFPLTINAGKSATLNVTFDPTSAAAATGTLTISSNSSGSGTTTIGLSGTGVSLSVQLNWSAPTSSPATIKGYDIYRATGSSSTYQLLNSAVDANTSYIDSTAASGTSYSYYVTSVDTAGAQSVPSNTATVAVPTN